MRAAAAAGAVLAIALLGGMLVLIAVQLDTLREQRRIADRQLELVAPLVELTRPLVRETRESLPQTRRTARRVDRLARAATPLARELLRADAGEAARSARAVGAVLLEERRLRRALAGGLRVIHALERHDLVRRGARAATLAPRTIALLEQLLAVQRRSLVTLQQSVAVQRETERHVESLDRKTGGPLVGGG